MGFCEHVNELPVFINGVEFVDKLSRFGPCSLVALVKAVLLPETTDRKSALGPCSEPLEA
jgi:hypothetical protein